MRTSSVKLYDPLFELNNSFKRHIYITINQINSDYEEKKPAYSSKLLLVRKASLNNH